MLRRKYQFRNFPHRPPSAFLLSNIIDPRFEAWPTVPDRNRESDLLKYGQIVDVISHICDFFVLESALSFNPIIDLALIPHTLIDNRYAQFLRPASHNIGAAPGDKTNLDSAADKQRDALPITYI